MENGNYRHELKFICTQPMMYIAEDRLRHICRPDRHGGADGSYRVRSLYFDTPDDRCFQDNLAGTDRRGKYRVRIYNGLAGFIRLECKHSRRGLKLKESCRITEDQCRRLMAGGMVRDAGTDQGLLVRFLVDRSMKLLMPKVIVEYVRTPWVCSAGNVRITFDRRISSSPDIGRFLEEGAAYRSVMPQGMHIMEVKYDKVLPGAVAAAAAGGQQWQRVSVSKYVLGRRYRIR